MKKWLLIFVLAFSLPVFSQIQGESEVSLRGDLIEPEFEGGLKGFQKVFYAMIKEKKVKRGEVVVASFVIDKNGILQYMGGIDSIPTAKAEDIAKATPYFANAMRAVLAGTAVNPAVTKPYGCSIKY